MKTINSLFLKCNVLRLSTLGYYLIGLVLLAFVYFLAAKLGLLLSFVGDNVSAVWPPTGIALAVLVRYGRRWTPGIFIGAFWVTAITGVPWWVAFGIATGNTLEALMGAFLLKRSGFNPQLGRVQDVLSWCLLAAFTATLFSATIGTGSLILGHVAPLVAFWDIWWVWWVGDAMGALVIGSLLLVLMTTQWHDFPKKIRDWQEAALILAALTMTAWLIFSVYLPLPDERYPLAYLIFPFIIWAALRFRQLGAVTSIFVACGIAIWETIHGGGPFVRETTTASLVLLMAYMLVITVTALLMAASRNEQLAAKNRLQLAQHVLDKATVGILWFNPQGRCVYANEAICQLLNYPAKQLLKRFIWHLTPLAGPIPNDWPAPIWNPLRHNDNTFETVYWHNQQTSIPVEVTADILHFSEQEYLCIFIRDITLRQKTELKLRQLSRAVEQSANSVIITNLAGEIEFVNPAFTRITGYTYAEVMGQTPSILKSGEHSEKVYKTLWQTIQGGDVWQGELYNRKKTGELYWEAITITPVRDSHHNMTHYLAIKEDISERKATEQALALAKEAAEVANKAKSRFIANMSHELRTPLHAILGYTQLLTKDHSLTDEQQRFIQTIHGSGEYLLAIFNDILDFSKIETGHLTLNIGSFDTASFFQKLLAMFTVALQDKKLTLNSMLDSSIPETLLGDELRIRQVLVNLLANAIKFTQQGQVTLKVYYDAEHLVIVVSDTGVGIVQTAQEKIFQPFQQSGEDYYKPEGTGLGLAITKNLVDLMQGHLMLESALGQGSTFTVHLPLPAVNQHSLINRVLDYSTITGFRYRHQTQQACHILIADDVSDNRDTLIQLLKPLGFTLTEAEDGDRCFAMACANPPDVILLDLVMPHKDGLTVTRLLREQAALANTIIIMVSASALDYEQQQSIAAGCQAYLTKPVKMEALLNLLQQQLDLIWLHRPEMEINITPKIQDIDEQLSPEAHQQLLSALKRGSIHEVRNLLTQFAATENAPELLAQLQQYNQRFDLRAMRTLLEAYAPPI